MVERGALKLGFLGGGISSAVGATHFIASQMDHHFEVVAGCFSRDRSRNLETAEKWGVNPERVYGALEEMLTSEAGRLDAIAILTPTPQHPEQVVSTLRAGFHVICEKALAPSLKSAIAIETVVRETKKYLAVTFNYSGYPMIRELRALIKNGCLGELHHIQIEMPQEGFLRVDAQGNPAQPQNWRLKDGAIPTVSLDLGVHIYHLVDFLTDLSPKTVIATYSSDGNFPDIIDSVSGIARYEHDLLVNFWYSKTALGHRNGLRVRVFGDRGSAEWFQHEPETLSLTDRTGVRSLLDRSDCQTITASLPRYNRFKVGHPSGFIEAFANLYADIALGLRNETTAEFGNVVNSYSIRKARAGLEFLDAIQMSVTEGCWSSIASAD